MDKPIDVTMTREVIHIQVVKSALYGDIGYVRLSSFNEESQPKLKEAIEKLKAQDPHLKGLVFDLRNNPCGLLDAAVDNLRPTSSQTAKSSPRVPATPTKASAGTPAAPTSPAAFPLSS